MISLVKRYLDINYFSDQKEAFEDLFLSHPNYPSIFAITDSLDMLSVENIAIKVPKEQLPELPDSFLAIFKEELVLVSKTDSLIKIEAKGEKKNISTNEFLEDWNGVIVAVEPNEIQSGKGNGINFGVLRYALPLLALILLSIVFNKYGLNHLLTLLPSIIGLVISVFIVQEKFGYKNEVVSKLCNINPNASCDSVIKSDKSEINKWVGFTDLPLIFFAVNVLAVLLQPNPSAPIVGLLSLIALPVIAYSVWMQKFQLKKWCVLCLAVSFLILTQAIVFWFGFKFDTNIVFTNLYFYSFVFIVISSIWLFLKPIFENKIKAERSANELKKFKRNYKLFKFLAKEIPVQEGLEKLEGLNFGNRNADLELTIIISPSCGHCHKAFQDAHELYSKFPEKIFLNILFNINPENSENPYKTVVENLLAIQNHNPEKAAAAIIDWHVKKMGLEEWKEKWVMNMIDMKVNHQIYQQYRWCLENEFNYTPIKIINGKMFPNEYEINELRYFLNDFSEEKAAGQNLSIQA
ncbi:vitamin K epoxide reductase family protein [Flavobacterium sp.]|uniref:vitamin K epoxide reductase family protein n=1 Tax=Flavobacterium sp. TaxID=239 RepID=UPI003D6AFF0C